MLMPMKLIGIAGATASGKTTLARGLITHFSAHTKRFSEILSLIATEVGLPSDKESLQKLSTTLRGHLGEDVLAHGMSTWVEKSTAETIVVEGLRRKTDIRLLSQAAQKSGRAWIFIFVDAPFPVRFSRFNGREGTISEEAFKALDEQECEAELPLIKKDAHLLLNSSLHTPTELVHEAIAYIQKDPA